MVKIDVTGAGNLPMAAQSKGVGRDSNPRRLACRMNALKPKLPILVVNFP